MKNMMDAAEVAAQNWLGSPVVLVAVLVVAVVLLLVVMAFLTYRVVKERELRRQEALEARLRKEHETKVDDLRQKVLTGVSQELLTPITLIIGPLQQLASEPLPPDVGPRVQLILRNAQMLLHQVNMLPVGLRGEVPPYVADVPEPTAAATPQAAEEVATVAAVDDSNAAEVADLSEDGMLDEEMTAANHRFTMLMVDDSADMCRFVRDYFRGEYNVITANNGQEAVKCLDEIDNIDLVVSDVTMPKMDGLELCHYIKSDLRWSHIPVILLTGHTAEEMEMEGLKMGADDYITKPFNAEMLRLRVKKLVETKENRQKQFKERLDVSPSEITITSVDEQFIQRAIKICEEHLSDTDFSVEALGHELSMSRTYLYKKLMNITGKGPAEFIRIIRLKRGKQYLEQSNKQIAEIAATLGYNSPKRFTENFKAEFGMSPSEYQRKFRAEQENIEI